MKGPNSKVELENVLQAISVLTLSTVVLFALPGTTAQVGVILLLSSALKARLTCILAKLIALVVP
jgi:hypothetical protein